MTNSFSTNRKVSIFMYLAFLLFLNLNVSAEAVCPASNYIARRIEVHESQADAFKASYNTTIESCWMHHLGNSVGAHADAVQVLEGKNILIQGNYMESPDPLPAGYNFNAALMASTGFRPIDNLVFDNNWADGGAFSISTGHANITVTTNDGGYTFDCPVSVTELNDSLPTKILETKASNPIMHIRPNPSSKNNKLYVDLLNFEGNGDFEFAVFDITGKKVYTYKDDLPYNGSKSKKSICINAELKKGAYIVVVNNGSETQKFKLIVN